MHIRTNHKTAFAVMLDRVTSDGRCSLADGVLPGLELAEMIFRERRLAGYVKAHHRYRNARLKNDARRLGIHVDIEFGSGRDVSSRQKSPHHDEGPYNTGKRR